MKFRIPRTSTLIAASLALIFAGSLAPLSGCKSEKDKAAQETKAQVSSFRSDLGKLPKMIDNTMSELTKVTGGQNPKRADQFREFQKDLSTMRSQARMIASEAAKAEADSNAYFAAWAKESNRAAAADRPKIDEKMAISKANRDTALEYFTNARRDFSAMVASLTEIETKLQKDMSDTGVQSIMGLYDNATRDSVRARGTVERLVEQIDAALAKH